MIGLADISRDVPERHESERHRKSLVHELNHRLKNTLATVQAIAAQALRGRAEPEALAEFDARLHALATAYDILTERSWIAAGTEDVVAQVLNLHDGGGTGRIALDGDGNADLSPKAAIALSMALRELAANAAKHGALSIPEGCVRLGWRTAFGAICLVWEESGGPPVLVEPTRQGLGMRLVRRCIADELGGSVTIVVHPTGITCRMEVPLTSGETACKTQA